MSREENFRKKFEEMVENQHERVLNGLVSDSGASTTILTMVLAKIGAEMAAANDINAKFIESHEERIDPLFKIPEFDKEGALSFFLPPTEKPAMKRLRDFKVGDEVWVKVKVEELEDKDGDVEVSLPRRNRAGHTYLGGNVEAHQ